MVDILFSIFDNKKQYPINYHINVVYLQQEWQQSTGQNYDFGMPLMLILNANGVS